MSEKVELEQKYIKQAEFIARGTDVLPGGIMELAKVLQKSSKSNKPLRIKLGMDPTRPDLHLGHSVVMRKLKQFQDLGHHVILLIGGATAMVGDPSGKSDTRPSLTKEEVEANAQTYFAQMGKVVNIEKAEVVNNVDWLHKLDFTELLKLSSKVTVAQMLEREDFSKRYKEGKPISIHEFFYPLMQAYDSVEVKADIELGGTDQRFNVLMGRELQAAYKEKSEGHLQMVMLLPLLEGTDGVIKMSKSYPENCISINEDPKDMYGKIMSIPDGLILRYYELLTDVSTEEIQLIKNKLEDKNFNPRNLKMELAYTITAEYNGNESAKKAQDNFINVVQKKGTPEDIKSFEQEDQKLILEVIVELGFAKSKGEAKRLIAGGGVKLDGEKVKDIAQKLDFSQKAETILQSGKRNFAKLTKRA